MPKTILTLLLLTILTSHISAQQLPVATNFKHAYVTQTRTTTGAPGKNYWQNTGKYNIKVNFNPSTRELTGAEGIDYTNNSPDTLTTLVIKLYPNLYQAQSMRNMPVSPNDLTTGMTISALRLGNKEIKHRIIGTNMYLRDLQILPGQSTHLDISFNYTLNRTSFIRTGQVDTGAFVIAYFYPRIAVYDDIDGWNDYPYIGREEFYNDYCDFSVDITIPANYACWATGTLTNPEEVYHPNILRRLSGLTDTITDIIRPADWQTNTVLTGTGHWHYEATNVTDFTFTTSNHYNWQASTIEVDPTTKRCVQANTVFNSKNFEPLATYLRKIIHIISYTAPGIPFPYPHETIFEGLDAMEYPMMVNNMPFDGLDAVQFTMHEVYHTIFPFYVGSNETKYSFMDEGFATYAEFMLLKDMQTGITGNYDLSPVDESAGTDIDMPIMTPTAQLYGKARFSNKDLKPALGLRYVNELLGDELFYKAVRHYISQWQGKHPTPYDMFASLNEGAGTNLNWFWQNWFFEKNIPDLAIDKVTSKSITIKRVGEGMVPIHLTVTYTDGTTTSLTRNISCWKNNQHTVTFHIKKTIAAITLGDGYDADADHSNNRFGK
jgi:hypothetical protein